MAGIIARRVGHLALVLFLVSLGTFFLLSLTSGDPGVTILGENATPQAVQQIDHQLGLDRPVLSRYEHWISGVLHGDLGESLVPPGGTVASRIGQALPVSLELAVLAELLALVLAVPVAVWSAYRQGGVFDRLFSGISFGLVSVPSFVSGLVLALVVALDWRLLPRGEWVRLTSSEGLGANLSHALLPALSLAFVELGVFIRVLRADMIETLREDFVATARAKGLSTPRVLFRHALRPSSFSLVTLSGVSLGRLIGGTVIVEVIFGLPGLGRLLVGAVGGNDYPLVQGIVLVVAVAYVLLNQAVDLLYAALDPRTRRHVPL